LHSYSTFHPGALLTHGFSLHPRVTQVGVWAHFKGSGTVPRRAYATWPRSPGNSWECELSHCLFWTSRQ